MPKRTKVHTWKPTVEDERLMREIKAKLGVVSASDVVRMALRKLAEAHGIATQ
jgi:hypothetical protein